MQNDGFSVVLVDYDEDLFTPPADVGKMLASQGIQWIVGRHRTPRAVLDAARSGDVVMVQSVRPLLTRDIIEQLDRCRCIVRLGIGYDSVDTAAATERGIILCNVPAYCVDDVAEHALALLLDSVRHVSMEDRWIRGGRWDRTGARRSVRMAGRTMGFVAFGRIARTLADRVKGFGMTLLAADPFVDAEVMAEHGVQKVELDELLRRSDFVSVHAPLTPETRHMIGRREFELMKEGTYLVNTSRGPLVDAEALAEALRSGKLWGAGLDVMEHEPLPANSPLREVENLVLTPHIGANSEESRLELYRAGAQIAIDIRDGRWPQGVVNPEVVGRMPRVYSRD